MRSASNPVYTHRMWILLEKSIHLRNWPLLIHQFIFHRRWRGTLTLSKRFWSTYLFARLRQCLNVELQFFFINFSTDMSLDQMWISLDSDFFRTFFRNTRALSCISRPNMEWIFWNNRQRMFVISMYCKQISVIYHKENPIRCNLGNLFKCFFFL